MIARKNQNLDTLEVHPEGPGLEILPFMQTFFVSKFLVMFQIFLLIE